MYPCKVSLLLIVTSTCQGVDCLGRLHELAHAIPADRVDQLSMGATENAVSLALKEVERGLNNHLELTGQVSWITTDLVDELVMTE